MPRKCSVPDCHSSSGFKFPRNPRILKLWKRALNISQTKQLNERCIVCLKHFTPDDFAKISKYTSKLIVRQNITNVYVIVLKFLFFIVDCELIRKQLNKDAVPSLLLPKQDDTLYGEISDEEIETKDIKPIIDNKTLENVVAIHENQMECDSEHGNISSILSATDFLEVNTSANADVYDHFLASEIFSNVSQNFALNDIQPTSTNTLSSQESNTSFVPKQNISSCSVQNDKPTTRSLSTQTNECKTKNVSVQTFRVGTLSFNFIKSKKGGITYFTGLKSVQIFELILQKLNPSPTTLLYKYHNVNNMTEEDQLLITLVKLRRVSPDFELSVLFDTCNKSIQNIFTSWINFMFNQLIKRKELWPSKDVYDFFASEKFEEDYEILQNTQLFGVSVQSEEKGSHKLSEVQKVINMAKFTYKILKSPLAKYYQSMGSRIFMACCFLANFKFEHAVIPEEVIIKTEDFSD